MRREYLWRLTREVTCMADGKRAIGKENVPALERENEEEDEEIRKGQNK